MSDNDTPTPDDNARTLTRWVNEVEGYRRWTVDSHEYRHASPTCFAFVVTLEYVWSTPEAMTEPHDTAPLIGHETEVVVHAQFHGDTLAEALAEAAAAVVSC